MATLFFSNSRTFLSSIASTSCSSSSSSSSLHSRNHRLRTQHTVCKSGKEPSYSNDIVYNHNVTSRRSLTAATTALLFMSSLSTGYNNNQANAAILEAEDDEELLEKVKRDRKKRLERQGVISSSSKETAYLQDLIYKLSKVGQAIEQNDLPAASSVLGPSKDTEWVQKVNSALNKLSSSDEEKTEVDTFNSSLGSLISSVSGNDIEASKVAFVASATAFERWTALSGLVEQLKGL